MLAEYETMEDESRPPLKQAPTGTSLLNLNSKDFLNKFLKISTFSMNLFEFLITFNFYHSIGLIFLISFKSIVNICPPIKGYTSLKNVSEV